MASTGGKNKTNDLASDISLAVAGGGTASTNEVEPGGHGRPPDSCGKQRGVTVECKHRLEQDAKYALSLSPRAMSAEIAGLRKEIKAHRQAIMRKLATAKRL